ncbi:ERV/ALR sulfhydryl oxidase [Fadolivirus algeromassiliense]|jgi:hypothetical protein|uniref:Sulfhydryl oxidase n=1 Tax=Fadolivirus FV1/VV64 TaxID=3070911 RepID=A0A7D3QWD5_9VIRU|nr:ERV/ALR sulfhydryl oxidase [Fadolivirus algeromassiliense]QKF93520.1 ERV/ALR sulfhydryl oxidase [Fadolivirus FV1/VV64]
MTTVKPNPYTSINYKDCCPELWKELHLRALNNNQTTAAIENAFLTTWMSKIPIKGCKCSDSWFAWYRYNHPDFNNYFEWTVRAHNAVNQKLRKPIWTVEQARIHWSQLNQK